MTSHSGKRITLQWELPAGRSVMEEQKLNGVGIFWFWNQTPGCREIDRQLKTFADNGISSVYIHTMPDSFRKNDFKIGMKCPYLGKIFFQCLSVAVNGAKRLGLNIFLYDEGGWPSGTVVGELIQKYPQSGIKALKKNIQTGAVDVVEFTPECHYPDLMSPETARHFIELVHQRYDSELGDEFGKTIKGIFTDEPRMLGELGTEMIPYSPAMKEDYHSYYGGDIEECFPYLFSLTDQSEQACMARRRYGDTICRLLAENFYRPIGEWCRAHRLLYEGHLSGENEIHRHYVYLGDFFQNMKHFDIVGIDTIWRQIFPGKETGIFARLAPSSAIANDQEYTSSESFSVYGMGITPAEMRYVANAQIIRGINRINLMAGMYSTQGLHKVGCGCDISARQPNWEHLKEWVKSVDSSTAFSSGAIDFDLWVYYRMEIAPEEGFANKLLSVCRELEARQLLWRFASQKNLDKLEHTGKTLLIVKSENDDWSENELELIKRFTAGGNRVITDPQSEDFNFLQQKYSPVEPLDDMKTIIVNQVRTFAGKERMMFFNSGTTPALFRFKLKQAGFWGEVLPDTNIACASLQSQNEGVYTVSLESGALCILEKNFNTPSILPRNIRREKISLQWTPVKVIRYRVGDNITSQSDAEGVKILPNGEVRSEQNSSFSGKIRLRAELHLSSKMSGKKPLFLHLKELFFSGELFCNGRSCGVRPFPPYAFELSHGVSGKNILELEVANTLAESYLEYYHNYLKVGNHHNSYWEMIVPFMHDNLKIGVAPEVWLEYAD